MVAQAENSLQADAVGAGEPLGELDGVAASLAVQHRNVRAAQHSGEPGT